MDNMEKLIVAIGRISAFALPFDSYEAEYIGDDFSLNVKAKKGYSDEE